MMSDPVRWSGGAPAPTGFPYAVPLRWADFDRYGHVHNAVYASYLETAREQFFEDAFGVVPGFVLVRLELDYVREILEEEKGVYAAVWVEYVGTRSFRTREQLALADGTLVADSRVTCVLWEPDLHRTRTITDDERARLAAHSTPQGSERSSTA